MSVSHLTITNIEKDSLTWQWQYKKTPVAELEKLEFLAGTGEDYLFQLLFVYICP